MTKRVKNHRLNLKIIKKIGWNYILLKNQHQTYKISIFNKERYMKISKISLIIKKQSK